MSNMNIPRKDWPEFCERFSQQHNGWLVTLTDVHSRLKADQLPEATMVAQNLALRQISAERDGHNVGLRIVAGDGPRRITHLVLDPAKIQLEKSSYGVDRSLRICDDKNQSTVVRFNLPRLQ